MKVLSLFDGISCARVALGECEYYASEIDKHAIKVAKKNYPSTVHLGDVKEIGVIPNLDLLIGGSPCQDLSIAKKGREGLKGERSGLFYEYVRIWKLNKPKWFILENVASMPKEARDEITKEMGVSPIMINASLVSAQCRKRLFWTNIPVVGLPEDRKIMLKDILESGEVDSRMTTKGKAFCLDASYYKGSSVEHSIKKKNRTQILGYKTIRKLTPTECERLQCLPDNYTEGISNTQRYKCLGNAFNVDVIRFILSFISK